MRIPEKQFFPGILFFLKGEGKMKNKRRYFYLLIAVFALIIVNTTAVFATDLSVSYNKSFYSYDKYGNGGSVHTNKHAVFSANDSSFGAVYCCRHGYPPPQSTTNPYTYYDIKEYKDNYVKKVMYYGWNGIKPWEGFKNSVYNGPYLNNWSGNAGYSKAELCGRSVTAMALSEYYESSNPYNFEVSGLKEFKKFLSNQPDPPSGFRTYLLPGGRMSQDLIVYKYEPEGKLMFIKQELDDDKITERYPDKYSLKGAEFKVYRDQKLTDPVNLTFVTDENGFTSNKTLKAGTYYAKEIKAPKGFRIDNEVYKIIVREGQGTIHNMYNKPLQGDVKVKKTVSENNLLVSLCSENYNLKGAEYRLYNDKELNNFMNITLVTDEKGETDAVKLPVGTYYMQEYKAPEGFELDKTKYEVVVSDGKTTIVKAADKPVFDSLNINIIKKAEEGTNTGLSLKDAEYKVEYFKEINKPGTNERIVSEEEIKELNLTPFRTWVFRTDENGIAEISAEKEDEQYKWYVPDQSDSLFINDEGKAVGLRGTYVIKETKAPYGYALSDEVWIEQFDFDHINQTVTSDIQNIEAYDKPQTVSITIKKTDYDTGKSEAQGFASLEGGIFEILYYDMEKGKYVSKGEVVTDENGMGTISGLKPGSYEIKEIEAPEGYVKTRETVTVEAAIKEYNTASFEYEYEFKNKVRETEIIKYNDNTDNLLEGAEMKLTDQDGNTVITFTTGKENLIIKGLRPGEYTLSETGTPDGYVKASDITFNIDEETERTVVKMEDIKVSVLKTDEKGNPLKGAELVIKDMDGNVIDSWISSDDKYYITGLSYNERYVLEEVCAPEGYTKSAPVEFTVNGQGETEIVIKNDKVQIPVTGDKSIMLPYIAVLMLSLWQIFKIKGRRKGLL